jgi:hypothetical protein
LAITLALPTTCSFFIGVGADRALGIVSDPTIDPCELASSKQISAFNRFVSITFA